MVGQLPGFQGNIPIQLKTILADDNITKCSTPNCRGATGWMDSLDPKFQTVATAWMNELLSSFGTDHWYQLDGYFDGGTAPWMREAAARRLGSGGGGATPPVPDPTWHRRGVEAYRSLTAADPDATWSPCA